MSFRIGSFPVICMLVIFMLLISPHATVAQEKKAQADTKASDANLFRYFTAETRKLAEANLADIKSGTDWKQRKGVLREQLFEMLGLSPRPQKTDLKVKYTGTTKHDEFVVKKLHFQSRPGLYVTGNLYMPKEINGKLPAILYVCGHGRVAKNGVSFGNKVHYHHHGSWFARNGYICLTIDTLQLGEIEGIHHGTYREKMWWWLNRGYTPAGVEAWNCIRALDLLQSLPEVDGERLGVTGRSGGGAYSWWIAALDERIKCAVPVAGITDLKNHVVDGCVEGHCDCMFMVNTYRWDYSTVAALVAPRPLLISNTDNDRIFPLDGVYRTYRQVRRVYSLLGADDHVGLHITKGPHKDTQELRIHAFRWFNHYLKNDDSLVSKAAEKYFEPEQLKVFEELPNQQINTRIHETFVPVAKIDTPESADQWKKMAARLKRDLLNKSFRGFPERDSELTIKVSGKKIIDEDKIEISRLEFESQKHVPLMVTVLHRGKLNDINSYRLMVVGDQDAAAFGSLSQARIEKLAVPIIKRMSALSGEAIASLSDVLDSKGKAIAIFAPRGTNDNRWNPNERFQTQARRRFYLLGQTADGMRIYDVKRAIEVLRKVSGNAPKIILNARGKMAVSTVYAAMIDNNVAKLELIEPNTTHRNGPYLLNVSRILNVPQAIAVAALNTSIQIRTSETDAFQYLSRIGGLGGGIKPVKINP